jgi:arylsulfatase A
MMQKQAVCKILVLILGILGSGSFCAGQIEPEILGRGLREWQKQLNSNDASARQEAVRALGAMQFASTPDLRKATRHSDPVVRYWSAVALADSAQYSSEVVDALSGLLSDQSAVVRIAAAKGLCTLSKEKQRNFTGALAVLIAALEHADPAVRLQAALALDELGPATKPALSAIQRAVKDKDNYVQRVAEHVEQTITTRPNFVVILCDDLGYGDLGCFGHPMIKTPNLDRLAAQGWRLTDCYSASPVCSASRCGLLTGRTPSRAGVYDWIPADHPMHLRQDEATIPSLLKQAGYATCHVGKWHLNGKFNSSEQPQPGDHGFDHWFSTQNNAAPTHLNPTNFVRNGEPAGTLEGYSCQVVADEAIRWLGKRDAQQPFFLFVCFHEPHEPIDSPPDLVAEYPEATKKGQALHHANVTNMDRAVGRLTAALDDLKLTDNTLVYFSSDNGPETLDRYPGAWRSHGSPGPLRGMKLHLYEAGMRVPGIVRWPGHVKPGQVVQEPVCSLDLLPTFCELAGTKPPEGRTLDGVSIVPLLEGQDFKRSTPLYWHYYRSLGEPKAAMRVGDWMVLGLWDAPQLTAKTATKQGDMEIVKSAKLIQFELYNLHDDVGEKKDLAAEQPERLKELSSLLVKKYQEVQAEGHAWPNWPQPKPRVDNKPATKKAREE